MTEILTLIILIFHPSGGFDRELYPVEVAVCQEVDGRRVEDSSCGIRACLKRGRVRLKSGAKSLVSILVSSASETMERRLERLMRPEAVILH